MKVFLSCVKIYQEEKCTKQHSKSFLMLHSVTIKNKMTVLNMWITNNWLLNRFGELCCQLSIRQQKKRKNVEVFRVL